MLRFRALRRICFACLVAAWAVPSILAQDAQPPDPPAGVALGELLSPLQAQLETEVRRAREALAELRRTEEALERQRAADEAEDRALLDRAAALRLRVDQVPARSPAVDGIYEEVVRLTVSARERLRGAVDGRNAPSAVPRHEPALDVDALRGSTAAARLPELERSLEQIRAREGELDRAERQARRERIRLGADVLRRVNALRIDTLRRMSSDGRRRLLGFTTEGMRQLRRELGHVALTSRVYALTAWERLRGALSRLRDPVALSVGAWGLLKAGLVVALFVILWRRVSPIHDGLRDAVRGSVQRAAWRRRLEALLGATRIVIPWILLLLALRGMLWAIGTAAALPDVRLVYELAVLYALYRLSIDLLTAGLLALLRRYRLEVGPRRTPRVLRSVRALLRVAFAVLVLLRISARFVGEGYLYHVALRLALAAIALTLIVIFHRWREDIVAAYLARAPAGRLRSRVEQARNRWYGGLLAASALAWLAGRALMTLARDFALGFDQTRHALAFLFRRRVEKQAERTGYAEPDAAHKLPRPLLDALSESPVDDERLLVDYFPGLDELHAAVQGWRDNGSGGSFLLTGDLGVGRTSWLGRISPGDVPVQRVTFETRIESAAVLSHILGPALGLGELQTEDELRARILDAPPRVIVIDRGQNLFLARVGGYRGFEAFAALVEDTAAQVFWVVAFSQLAYEHIAAVHPELAAFRRRHTLAPWPEERIRELIRQRVAAGGVEVSYDDLVLDSLKGLSPRARDAETEQAFTRLLWDYSQGLPRVALHYWKRSLVPQSDGRVRVRLFREPDVESLEEIGDASLFLLAGVVVHESLTLTEMSIVTRYPEALCRIHAARLSSMGVIYKVGERHWVTSYWQPVVRRLLDRRNLIFD